LLYRKNVRDEYLRSNSLVVSVCARHMNVMRKKAAVKIVFIDRDIKN